MQHVQLGAGAHVLERDQRVALAHPVAVADVDGGDDAALEVLHGLALALGADHAGCHRRARERHAPGPGPAAAEEEGDDRPADEPLPAREGAERGAVPGGREHRRGAGAHGAAPVAPAAGTAPAACGRPAIGTTLRREPSTVSTSSRGPAWTTSPARR